MARIKIKIILSEINYEMADKNTSIFKIAGISE